MEKSQTLAELAKALTAFQAEVPTVKKDGKNPFFHSKYATLEGVIETIKKPLHKHGLSFSQFPTGENQLVTILMHSSGEYIMSTAKMYPKDSTPQGQGSAITYMRRYALSAILGIATEEDDDGNASSRTTKAAVAPKMAQVRQNAIKPMVVPIQPEMPTDGPVVDYGSEEEAAEVEAKPPTPVELKKKIFQLCKMLKLEAKREKVEKITSLPMTDVNLPEILTRLESIYKEQREAEREINKANPEK